MAEEIFPGIYRLSLPLPNLSLDGVNVFLLQTDDGWILVDTGLNHPQSYQELNRQLDTIGIRKDEIQLIVLTHNHPDHSGMAGRLQAESNAALAVHENDAEGNKHGSTKIDKTLVRNGLSEDRIVQLKKAGQQMEGMSKPYRADWVLKGDEHISAGRYCFQVIWTPGHSPGHVCLYDRERQILLSGDHILPKITPNIGYGPNDPLADYLSSLKKIQALPVRIALPSHGEQINDTKQRIKEMIAHHQDRISEMLHVLGLHKRTAFDIASGLQWKGGSVSWADMDSEEQSMALLETLSHLQYMVNKKSVNKTESDDFVYYQAT